MIKIHNALSIVLWGSPIVMASFLASENHQMAPPKPPKIEKKLVKHGDERIDHYYWMKERENPEVLQHLKAENAYTENMLQPIDALKKELFDEMVARIQKEDSTVPVQIDDYYYYSKFNEQDEYPVIVRRQGDLDAREEVILNSNELAKGKKFFLLSSWKQSPNHQFLAFATDTLGRRFYTIQIKDLQTGQLLKTKIENITGNIVWAEDNRTLLYSKQNPQTLRFEWIYSIDIHTGQKNLVYHEQDEKFYTLILKGRSKKYLIISNSSSESSESWLIDAKRPHDPPRLFNQRRPQHEYDVEHGGNFFFVRSNKNAKNFKIFRTSDEQKNC